MRGVIDNRWSSLVFQRVACSLDTLSSCFIRQISIPNSIKHGLRFDLFHRLPPVHSFISFGDGREHPPGEIAKWPGVILSIVLFVYFAIVVLVCLDWSQPTSHAWLHFFDMVLVGLFYWRILVINSVSRRLHSNTIVPTRYDWVGVAKA